MLLADDTSIFSILKDIDSSASNSNSHLAKISGWVFQWKMNFNSDPTKLAQEIILNQKSQKRINLTYF